MQRSPRRPRTPALAWLAGVACAAATHACVADVLAHHVRLTGTSGDQAQLRDTLITLHGICAKHNPSLGLPAKPLPPSLPTNVSTIEIDAYYADQRVTEDRRLLDYRVDSKDCGVVAVTRRLRELYFAAGACSIDLDKKEARGVCSPGAQGWTPNPVRAPDAEARRLAIAQAEPPPDVSQSGRAMWQQLDPVRQQAAAKAAAFAHQATGATQVIAGLRCEVHRAEFMKSEWCVARPNSPFPILSSAHNIGVPGLLLAADSVPPTLTLRAQEVVLGQFVAASLFVVPDGMRLLTPKGLKQ